MIFKVRNLCLMNANEATFGEILTLVFNPTFYCYLNKLKWMQIARNLIREIFLLFFIKAKNEFLPVHHIQNGKSIS